MPVVIGLDVPGKYDGAYAVYDVDANRILSFGPIRFTATQSERRQFKSLGKLLDYLAKKYHPRLLAIEHPFLYLIAQWVGGVKMWVSRRRGVAWYMLTASQARKVVLGSGSLVWEYDGQRKRNVTKAVVLAAMRRRFKLRSLSQHEADAILYAVAGATAYFTRTAERGERNDADRQRTSAADQDVARRNRRSSGNHRGNSQRVFGGVSLRRTGRAAG